MSDQVDPWDAMVQNNDSDEDYLPTGADGIDDEDMDFEDDDDYQYTDEGSDSDDDGLGDIEDVFLSPCILGFSCITSAERKIHCFSQMSDSERTESQTLQLWLRCRSSLPVGRVRGW